MHFVQGKALKGTQKRRTITGGYFFKTVVLIVPACITKIVQYVNSIDSTSYYCTVQ